MTFTPNTSTRYLIAEAEGRGIGVETLSGANPNLIALTFGGRQEFMYYTTTNQLGRVTAQIFTFKPATTRLLRQAGFPVPPEFVSDSPEAVAAFLAAYGKIVIKPLDSVWGQGVTPGITDPRQIAPALALARSFNRQPGATAVVCQQHIEGTEYRLLVINAETVFAVQRIPAHIVGDGQASIQELLDHWNQHALPHQRVTKTTLFVSLLREQRWALTDTPPPGTIIYLKRIANAHAGGVVQDVTDVIGESVRQISCKMARYFKAPVVGIDCISPDITGTIGWIIELNMAPDITLHHTPTMGPARNVAGTIIDMLFPETKL